MLCTGASLIIETSAHGVWAIILIILYREAGVGAEGREGRATSISLSAVSGGQYSGPFRSENAGITSQIFSPARVNLY